MSMNIVHIKPEEIMNDFDKIICESIGLPEEEKEILKSSFRILMKEHRVDPKFFRPQINLSYECVLMIQVIQHILGGTRNLDYIFSNCIFNFYKTMVGLKPEHMVAVNEIKANLKEASENAKKN